MEGLSGPGAQVLDSSSQARGSSLSGWASAPQSMWLGPFSFLHAARDITISTLVRKSSLHL